MCADCENSVEFVVPTRLDTARATASATGLAVPLVSHLESVEQNKGNGGEHRIALRWCMERAEMRGGSRRRVTESPCSLARDAEFAALQVSTVGSRVETRGASAPRPI